MRLIGRCARRCGVVSILGGSGKASLVGCRVRKPALLLGYLLPLEDVWLVTVPKPCGTLSPPLSPSCPNSSAE